MSATFTLEIQLAPNVETLLNKLIAAMAPKVMNYNQQLPPPSPAEQAARMRMQPSPVPIQQRPAPTYDPRNPLPKTISQIYPQTPSNPTPAAPYAKGGAPVVPIRNPQSAPVNPTLAGPSTAQQAAAPCNPAPVAAAPTYELDQLARATNTLAEANKWDQIKRLWQQFNMQQMDQLPKERYGEYATALRGLGVRI